MVTVPRLVIAAPASGSGKTTVACGLMAALRRRGLSVSGHKVGPDYIDPGYHEVAAGRPRRNLDPFLCGEDRIVPLFLHGAAGARAAIVEGVMGMFDGADPALGHDQDFGSTAHVARLIKAPVVLVVDASRAGRSVAALVAGFATFDPRTPVAGVILNRVTSDRHERLLREALSASKVRVYGAIRRTDAIMTPSRHLGLIPAAERATAARAAVAAMGTLVADSCDLDALLALAASAPALPPGPWDPAQAVGATGAAGVVAIAGGAAFTFGYTEQRELLGAAGLTVAEFDPLRDEDLPGDVSGVLIGGGFPETLAAELAANEPLRRRLAALAATSTPVVAECAGLLYLARTLDGHPMCGVIDAHATMTRKLTLGYRRARAAADCVLAREGEAVHGHEFHRTTITPSPSPAWRLATGAVDGHAARNVLASYLHVHWAGHPALARRFARAASTAEVTTCRRRLIGVGVGPGDPELVTVKAIRAVRAADVILVPVLAGVTEPGRAESIIATYVEAARIRRVDFALNDRGGLTPRRTAAWRLAGQAVAEAFEQGCDTVAFCTIGDPSLYSTFSYLAQAVTDAVPDVTVEVVPGITAMQDLAARAGVSLAEGTEPVTLVPLNGGARALDTALEHGGAVVGYKLGAAASPGVSELREHLVAKDRLDGAVVGARLGLPGELIAPLSDFAPDGGATDVPYLSTLIVPAVRRPGPGSALASANSGVGGAPAPSSGVRAPPTPDPAGTGRPPAGTQRRGKVTFVGAGPGAPDLITFRGARAIAGADVVIWASSLVHPGVLDHARPGAIVIDSARLPMEGVLPYYERAAAGNLSVARVHSGDPSLWGAVAEQLEQCERLDLDTEMIPGVSSFTAVAAAIGRELTIPEIAQSVILTRLGGGKTPMPAGENVSEFAKHQATMALFLSAARSGQLQDELLDGGYPQQTPCVVAYQVTWPDELILECALADLAATIREHKLWKHTLVLVGPGLAAGGTRSHLYHPGHFHGFRRADRDARQQLREARDGQQGRGASGAAGARGAGRA